jgi:predicted oxidoreductase
VELHGARTFVRITYARHDIALEAPIVAKDLSQALEERWTDYLRFRQKGEIFSAFARLAEITHCLNYANLPQKLAQKWRATVQNVSITDGDIRSIRTTADQRIQRLQRIVSVGTRFIDEEALLLITIRIELELLSAFLVERGIALAMDIAAVDDDLRTIATLPDNAQDFRSAQNAAKQNWGIPLHTRWIESFTLQ